MPQPLRSWRWSEGSAGEFIGNFRELPFSIDPLKAERQHKSSASRVPHSTGTALVLKIGDDHVASRANRKRRSLESRVLEVTLHHLFHKRDRFVLATDMHIHRERLTVRPLPGTALAHPHRGLD